MDEMNYAQAEKGSLFEDEVFNVFLGQTGDQLLIGDSPSESLNATVSTDHMIVQMSSQSQSTEQTQVNQFEQEMIDESLLGELEDSRGSDCPLLPEECCEAEQSEIGFSRRSLKGACPLVFFFKQGRPPKHEYYVAMIIRALKKAIRTLLSPKDYPKGGVFKVLKNNPSAVGLWEEFRRTVQPWLLILEFVAKTEAGPATDGKAKRKEESATHSSFNKSYIKDFYSSSYVRIAHFLFAKMIFSASPSALCSSMKFSCCEGRHSAVCSKKWNMLKAYTQKNIIEEVGLEPFLGT